MAQCAFDINQFIGDFGATWGQAAVVSPAPPSPIHAYCVRLEMVLFT